jgi:hypothetical protein
METPVKFYQTCIKHLLSEYETLSTQETEISLCFDDERSVYLVMRAGWFQKYKRIHRCLIHIRIENEIIVIEANNTEDPINTDLIRMGIPKEKICLGFIPADFRAYAEQYSHKRQHIESGT